MARLSDEPLIHRCAVAGAVLGLVLGAVGGLVRGLDVHAATAWFAAYELGIPGAAAGGLVGLLGGVIATACASIGRRLQRR
ncbi:MAG: hypothetical protein ACRDL5_08140 [Solirubrobacteraceae bacterium]